MNTNADFLQWFINVLVKKTSAARGNKFSGSGIKNESISNKWLTEESHKPIIRNFNKRKAQSSFIDNIWGADLAELQVISKSNRGFRFLLCVIDILSKYAWVIRLKEKKEITINNAFQKISDEPNCKPNKIWVDKSSKFCNRWMKSWFEKMT